MSRDRVVKFGSVTPLTGILTEPDSGTPRSDVSVILINSGILHHVGANRLHVQLARELARLGYPSLRFDLSGIGDSEARRDELSFEQSAPLEAKDAIDYLARSHGVRRVVLMGLCSGADVAHLTAVSDQRVVGLGLIDAWVYQTPAYYLHHYARRVTKPAVYVNWLKVRLQRIRDRFRRSNESSDPDSEMYEMPTYIREFPPREQVARELQDFMKRNIQLFCIFSGGLVQYNHQGQYKASFAGVDFGDRLREEHVADATHVFSALEHQAFIVRELSSWMTTRFEPAAASAEATSADKRTA